MKRYIPLNASESAVLPDADTLLPRDEVYEPLARMIEEAVKKAEAAKGQSLNQLREHNAISIDGARGTGKTAVLVNLKSYLKERDVLKDVHLFDPIDPTLLEEGESLFLHIIVAAVLHDKDVKEAQRKEPNKARNLNQTLEKLAQSLESIETQKNYHGMDKIRAMYSNKHLADCVQDFFREVLSLLGKKLLILPIDDVDTSLNRAFENLEIVRRYLATPYVLPIVSGDRELYNEVTWRDFHGRLTKDSSHLPDTAYETAKELAVEYQRKILPFPRRLTMPEINQYWQEKDIYLRDGEKKEVMPLRNFIAWLEIFLTGPVNGLEDSQLPLPIPSVRALTQLLNRCQDLIPTLPKRVKEAGSALQVKRAWQMPDVPEEAIEAFQKTYQQQHEAEERNYNPAYDSFATELAKQPMDVPNDWIQLDRQRWTASLKNHFQFETEAGPVFLVLQAQEYWQKWRNTPAEERRGSIFDTPLFQPLWHSAPNYQHFKKNHSLSDWEESLKEKLPKVWFRNLAELKTILPYPVVEIGCNTNTTLQNQLNRNRKENNKNLSDKATLLLNLLTEHYFYQPAHRTVVLNIGRIFEIIIMSLITDVELSDLQRVFNSAPFFSAKSQAQDITISNQDYISDIENEEFNEKKDESRESLLDLTLNKLQSEIADWRKCFFGIDKLDVSPWLIYKVFKKVYSTVSDNRHYNKGLDLEVAFKKAGLVFYATWSAFGSFEKGRLFGLPELVTNSNLYTATNFESNIHLKMNIGHLAPHRKHIELLEIADELVGNEDELKIAKARHTFGKKTRTITNVLVYHPLIILIDEVFDEMFLPPEEIKNLAAREHLSSLMIFSPTKYTTDERLKDLIETRANTMEKTERDSILEEMRIKHPDTKWTAWFEQLDKAIKNLAGRRHLSSLMKIVFVQGIEDGKVKGRLKTKANTMEKTERDSILEEMRIKHPDTEWTAWFRQICDELDQQQPPDQSPE